LDLQERINHLSTRPGVYLLKDGAGAILYVGKAKSLRARVRSYFRADAGHEVKTRELVRRVRDVETLVVGSEAEALILEANLIKEHKPRFNVQLRDDKRYPYIKVTVKEPFPRVYVTRRLVNDGSRYFGPYTSVGHMRQALEVVKRLYTVRSCRYDLPRERPLRPCLDYQIGRCKAPCVDYQSEADYRAMIDEILQVLAGDIEGIRRDAERRMRAAAAALDFEGAARLRDVLHGLDVLAREQRVQKFGGVTADVVGLARDRDLAVAVVLEFRGGRMIGRKTQRFSGIQEEDDASLLSIFGSRYYLGRGQQGMQGLPRELLFPARFPDQQLLEEVLSEAAGRPVRLRVPVRGEKRQLVELASTNARNALEDRVADVSDAAERAEAALFSLQHRLDLKVVPRLILCFDVSHTQGAETVASAVAFENGEPKSSDYRRMRIRGEWGNDDFRSMQEVVTRTLERRIQEERPIPDLVLVDGGKGQLSAAREALHALGLADLQLAALAKREEGVYLPGRADPIRLDRRDRALHLLQRIRNEAHRFAISYNRRLRARRTIRSDLSSIPGIGPRRQQALLARFGSVRGLQQASTEEIARVPGFSSVLAARVLTWLGR
jgi:excinuclease ABC subunit C